MKRAVTFDLPPSPRCVIQRHTVVLAREDALSLLDRLGHELGLVLGYRPRTANDGGIPCPNPDCGYLMVPPICTKCGAVNDSAPTS
jgi:hypothetical protein